MIKATKCRISIAVLSISMMVATASATIDSDLMNFSAIIGNTTYGLTGYFINMMNIFMQPPLVYFVVLGVFITFVHLVGSFLMKRGKK